MGAVRRLATVVIIGLVAISTTMVVYLAAEPDRRANEEETQNVVAIERGTDLYITYCLQCHGPAGLGAFGGDGRIGGLLDQKAVYSEDELKEMVQDPDTTKIHAIFQSDDPVLKAEAEDWLRFVITYGIPWEPYKTGKLMPAFGHDLNVEEMNEIVYLIMNGDWNYVYNTAVLQAGQQVAEEECAENPDGEYCDDTSQAPPAYPTVPSAAPANGDDEATPDAEANDADEDADTGESNGEASASIDAEDISFSTDQLTLKPGDTLTFTNNGQLEHDFVVDELDILELLQSGESTTITIPDDAEPGEYKFYCSIPGHEASGMFGTLTIEG